MSVSLILGRGVRRRVPPPLQPDGDGFFYLKRIRDGAILLDEHGEYVGFDDHAEARGYARRYLTELVRVCWMPKLRTN